MLNQFIIGKNKYTAQKHTYIIINNAKVMNKEIKVENSNREPIVISKILEIIANFKTIARRKV
jgi:hypothetical protein